MKFPQKGLKQKPAIIAGEDLARLLNQLEEPYRTMVSLIAATGLRIGELLALRWSVLDLDAGALAVRQSVYEGKFQLPKTQKAVRTIPLGRRTIAALKGHRERVTRTAPEDLVFGNRCGNPLRESKMLRNVLQPAAEKAGLGRVRWHQFRHIHSSLLNDLKVPVKIAQEQLGHASISTTLNIYTHVVDASHRAAIEQVERQLFPTVPKPQKADTASASETAERAETQEAPAAVRLCASRYGGTGKRAPEGSREAQAEAGPPSRCALRWTTFAWLANRSSRVRWQA